MFLLCRALYCGFTVIAFNWKPDAMITASVRIVKLRGCWSNSIASVGQTRAQVPQVPQCSASRTAFCGIAFVKGTAIARTVPNPSSKGSGYSVSQAYSQRRQPMHLSKFT